MRHCDFFLRRHRGPAGHRRLHDRRLLDLRRQGAAGLRLIWMEALLCPVQRCHGDFLIPLVPDRTNPASDWHLRLLPIQALH